MKPVFLDMKCTICDCKGLRKWNDQYGLCKHCGHHSALELRPVQIVNEALKKNRMNQLDSLDTFKRNMVFPYSKLLTSLIDVGSGSGKFLYQNKDLFHKVLGIEINKECADFSRNELNLEVSNSLPEVLNDGLYSFWHSLEHFNSQELKILFSKLNSNLSVHSRLIISVPRADSHLHKWLREDDPFYDPTSHYHEFSLKSLTMILERYNFVIEQEVFCWAYSIFGWTQGLSNKVLPIRNYFYYRFRRDKFEKKFLLDLLSILNMGLFLPISILLAILERFRFLKPGVMNIVAKKADQFG